MTPPPRQPPDNPLRASDEAARALARDLLAAMTHATLAVQDPATGHPHLSRILCQRGGDGLPLALLSGLAVHTRALARDPRAGLLIEAPPRKGDPMTWPRLSLQVLARRIEADDPALRAAWLARHPRSQLFLSLPDFAFWQLVPQSGLLNAGFGAAFRLGPPDLADKETPPQP